MRIVSWNMGCAPRQARYRKGHSKAWRYLLEELRPDICLVQEALLGTDVNWSGRQVPQAVLHRSTNPELLGKAGAEPISM